MADENTNDLTGTSSSSSLTGESSGNRTVADNIRELTNAGKALLEAGRQMTENLSELSQRVEHAGSVGSNVLTSPWLLVGGAVATGLVLILTSRRS